MNFTIVFRTFGDVKRGMYIKVGLTTSHALRLCEWIKRDSFLWQKEGGGREGVILPFPNSRKNSAADCRPVTRKKKFRGGSTTLGASNF